MVLDFVGEALATQRSSFGEFRAGVFHLFGRHDSSFKVVFIYHDLRGNSGFET